MDSYPCMDNCRTNRSLFISNYRSIPALKERKFLRGCTVPCNFDGMCSACYTMLLKGAGFLDAHKNYAGFCRAFLRSLDPERAAASAGLPDGFSLLGQKNIQARLDKMRGDSAGQIRKEDAVRRLAQLAFGRANDAVQLALHPQDVDADSLDLSAVSEFRVTDKGGVEVKLLDRVKALEALCGLLDCAGDANLLYQALENAAGQLEGGCGCN